MEIVKAGIHYIANGSNKHSTEILFCHKDEAGKFIDGLTNEELIDVVIARFQYLTGKNDSEQNIQCLLFARQIKSQLIDRNKDKLKRRQNDSRNSVQVQAPGGESRLKEVSGLVAS